MQKLIVFFTIIFLFFSISNAADKRAITVDDLFAVSRVADPQVSPDGKWVAYTVTKYAMQTNKKNIDIWLISINGGTPRQLTTHPKSDYHPRWSPVENKIAFISNRNGTSQIYIIPAFGGEATKLTDVSTEVNGFIWSPDGKYLAFTSEVYPDLTTDEENKKRNEEKQSSLVKAKIIDHLFYRYWNQWHDEKRNHVFVMDIENDKFWDVTPGDYDSPPLDLGSDHDFAFSPDSKEIAFVRNTEPMVAISTNNDIFITPIKNGVPTRITANKANDNNPVYSPDGQYIAYKAMKQPGYESDQYDIMLYNRATAQRINLTAEFDRDIRSFIFDPKGKKIYFTALNQGRSSVYEVNLTGGKVKSLIDEHYNHHLQLDKKGKTLLFLQESIDKPAELFKSTTKGKRITQLTFANRVLLSQLTMNPAEEFWFPSFDGQLVHGLIVKPPEFSSTKKYPLIYLIHGGPQGMWADRFHYRWNAQMFAAPGYVVAMVNFRGSRGYGLDFCKAVSKDWGGGPYKDLMKGLDYVLKTYNYIDTTKLAAAGASFGGFMINWIAGHTDRFKVLVSHAGVFDQISMYGATEELWFPEWEFNGTPYENPTLYEKWSPSRFVRHFKTPTLVIHSAHDFRVPVTQGFQMFTALQRMGVPSKLLYFPDEDHFVRKPQNARLWWKTVHEWIAEWIAK